MCGEGGVGGAGNDEGSGVLGMGPGFVTLVVDFPNGEGVVQPTIRTIKARITTAPSINNRILRHQMTDFCACIWYISLPI